MASNLQKRLDKIEKGLQQFLEAQNPTGPIYLTEGESVPEGRDAVVIVMQWVEAEVQEDALLEDSQSLGAPNSAQRKTPLTLPPSESAAERDKRWLKHLQAIDMRGDRYQGEEGLSGLSDIGRYYKRWGIV